MTHVFNTETCAEGGPDTEGVSGSWQNTDADGRGSAVLEE